MASNHTDAGSFRRMSEMNNYTIEKREPDPRGCTVIGTDGARIGTVVDLVVDTNAMKVRQLLVAPGTGDTRGADDSLITFDVNEVEVQPNTREVVARGVAGNAFTGSDAYRQRMYASDTGRPGSLAVARCGSANTSKPSASASR